MINPKARELWRRYLAEPDPQSAEMIYLEYLQALTEVEELTDQQKEKESNAA